MSHIKFYTILGFLSLGCGVLSVLSVMAYGWVLSSAMAISADSMLEISLGLFAIVFVLHVLIIYLSWPYGEKHVTKWRAWHALAILPVGIIPGILPWIITLRHV